MAPETASRRSLFAVWRWPWWTWAVALPFVPVVYLLSGVPVYFLILELGGRPPSVWDDAFHAVYGPAIWCAENISFVAEICDWEWQVIFWLNGTTEDRYFGS